MATKSEKAEASQQSEPEETERKDAPGGMSWADFVNRDRSADPE